MIQGGSISNNLDLINFVHLLKPTGPTCTAAYLQSNRKKPMTENFSAYLSIIHTCAENKGNFKHFNFLKRAASNCHIRHLITFLALHCLLLSNDKCTTQYRKKHLLVIKLIKGKTCGESVTASCKKATSITLNVEMWIDHASVISFQCI
jgi:hypothetical protein